MLERSSPEVLASHSQTLGNTYPQIIRLQMHTNKAPSRVRTYNAHTLGISELEIPLPIVPPKIVSMESKTDTREVRKQMRELLNIAFNRIPDSYWAPREVKYLPFLVDNYSLGDVYKVSSMYADKSSTEIRLPKSLNGLLRRFSKVLKEIQHYEKQRK